jgi:diguanylate cyclase (GGDEF)-like protein/PAS domain S-box-containing protein
MPEYDDARFPLAASAPVGIFKLSEQGEFLYGNQRFRRLMGIGQGDFDHVKWYEQIHPDDRSALEAEWEEATRQGREFAIEYRIVRPDGEVTWVDSRAVRVAGKNGEPATFVGSLTDITARKDAEQGLALSAEVMRDMAEGVCLVRASDRTIVFVNRTFERMLGYGPGELDGEPLGVINPYIGSEADTASGISVVDRVAAGEQVSYEAQNRRKDGSTIWCRSTVSRFQHPAYGLAWVSVDQDITAERESREALRAAEERFRRAFEDSATGMALVEGRGEEVGRFREVNRALVQISGYSPEELLQMSYWDLVHPDELDAMRRGVTELVTGRSDTLQAELRMIGAGETQHWINFNVSLLRDSEGEPLSAVVQAQDVTERKRFESELQYLADHDPLTGLYNRRRFALELERELAAAERYKTPGALLILDLDCFKLVNDSRGHSAGDALLVAVGRAIDGRVRTTDVVGRLGGDEFGIILPHNDRDQALATAESLRSVVAATVDAHAAGIVVTTSVGVAPFGTGEDSQGVERLVSNADAAMYSAKQAGRDRVHVFTDGQTRGALRAV